MKVVTTSSSSLQKKRNSLSDVTPEATILSTIFSSKLYNCCSSTNVARAEAMVEATVRDSRDLWAKLFYPFRATTEQTLSLNGKTQNMWSTSAGIAKWHQNESFVIPSIFSATCGTSSREVPASNDLWHFMPMTVRLQHGRPTQITQRLTEHCQRRLIIILKTKIKTNKRLNCI